MLKSLTFNLILDLTGIMGMIFLLFSICFHSALTTLRTKRLAGMMILFALESLADLVACTFFGRVDAAGAMNGAFALKMLFGAAMMVSFVSLLRLDLELRKNQWRIGTGILYVTSVMLMVSIFLNPFHQLYFAFPTTSGPDFHGEAFPYLCIYNCLLLSACLFQVLRRREAPGLTRFSLGFFCLIHIAAWIAHPFVTRISLVNIASLAGILMLSSAYYVEQNLKFAQQEQELETARAALVLSQIQPHFLFNSMTAVMDLCDTDPREAKAALQELSDYLHYKISALSGNFLVHFSEDLDFLQNYLKLEKRRYGDRLRVEYDLGPTDFQVPLLTLQPLAENAIHHGLSKKPEGGTLRILTREVSDHYVILVEDDGVGFDPGCPPESPGTHIGLNNVRSRLSILCGGSLFVHSTPGTGTTVEITIRKKEEPHENSGRG